MKPFLTAIAVVTSLAPGPAVAQERVGDAALGGLSGALVLGPVGAVAGIVVGYAAGPSISRSWGLRRADRHPDRTAQRARPDGAAMKQAGAAAAAPKPASEAKRSWNSPPVVGFE